MRRPGDRAGCRPHPAGTRSFSTPRSQPGTPLDTRVPRATLAPMNTRALSSAAAVLLASSAGAEDWPVLGHDSARRGSAATELRPPFTRQWYRLFADEGVQSGVQPVSAGQRVYLGTLAGVLHAMDADTGRDVWTFTAGGPILHAAGVGGRRVVCGAADG